MHSAAQHERGVRQGCALHPLRAGATATAEAGFLWGVGVGPVAGTLQVRPCKLGRRIHAAHAPQPDPRLRQISAVCGSTPFVDESLSDIEINRGQIRFPTENGSDPPFPMPSPGPIQPPPGNCRRRGGVGLRVSAAWMPRPSPQGRVYGVPAIRHRLAQPTENPEPLWLWLWLWPLPWQVQGAALPTHPSPAHENDFTVFSKPSSLRHASTILRSSMRPRATHAKKRPPIA